MRQSQRLCWSFTINNYDENDTFPDQLASYLIEAHELGESGTPHIQGYVQLKTPLTLNQMKQLCPTAHFEVARGTPFQNFLYCAKGQQTHDEWLELKELGPNYGKNAEFLEYGQRPKAPINAHKKKPKDTTYDEAIAAPTVREGMEIVQKQKPRDYCLHGDAIERNLRRTKKQAYTQEYALEEFNIPPLDLSKPVFLSGKARSGKTYFALAHFKNPLLVCHIDRLKELGPDHDGLVFDDMAFDHWPAESVIHLLDTNHERQIHVRYGTVTIPAKTKKIFTNNKLNIFYKFDADPEQIVAIESRYTCVRVTTNLFGQGAPAPSAYDALVGAHRPATLVAPGQFAAQAEWNPDDYEEGDMDQVD